MLMELVSELAECSKTVDAVRQRLFEDSVGRKLLDCSKEQVNPLQRAGVLAAGICDGIKAHGIAKMAEDPLGSAFHFAGGVAFGLALNAAPKCIAVPAAMLSGMSVLKLGQEAVGGVRDACDALQDVEPNPGAARKRIADSLGPVAVESLLMVAGAGAAHCAFTGAGWMRKAQRSSPPNRGLLERRSLNDDGLVGISPHEISNLWLADQSAGKRTAGNSRPSLPESAAVPNKLAVSDELVIPELRMTTEMSYADPSYFVPKLTKEAINVFLNSPPSKVIFRPKYFRHVIETMANDRPTIAAIQEKHLAHDLGPDYVKFPVLERQNRKVLLSTRHKDDPIAKLYNDVRESVVKVEAINERNAADYWNGSGAFVDANGTIATALHAVFDATKLSVRTASGELHPARLLSHDLHTDMALLKIDVPGKQFKPLALSSRQLQDGEKIFVFGHPAGNDNMFVSPGFYHRVEPTQRSVKNNLDKNKDAFIGRIYPENAYFAYTRCGNSGGPVVNSNGEIISIHTAAAYKENWNVSYGASSSEIQRLIRNLSEPRNEIKLPFSMKDAVEAARKK